MFREMLRRSNYFFMLVILAFGLSFTSCSDDDDDSPTTPVTINESEVLATYLESMNLSFPKITTASKVNEAVAASSEDVYLIDIRSKDVYDEGHVKGSHNVALADLLTHVESTNLKDKQIIIICYTGQTAAYGASLLRMMEYDAYSMKFGMCAWHTDNATKWNGAISNDKLSEFTSDVTEKPAAGALPELKTGKKTGAEILRARVEKALADGFGGATISKADLYTNGLTKYHIVNYWNNDDYLDPGHIEGAMQYTPNESLKLSTDLKTLPTDKPVVVYCFTGQTSAFVAAYLNVLGYDAKSLLFGTNSMIYDKMAEKAMTIWSEDHIMDYEKVTD